MFNYLGPSQQELIIDFLADEDIKAELALQLFVTYRDGDQDTSPFEEKADYYLGKYLLIKLPDNFLNQGLNFFSWFTTLRLCELRINRYWTQTYLKTNFLPKNFTVLQLSYLPETIFCIYKLVTHCFRPKKSNESYFSNRFEWRRFRQILSDREFISTFSNAVIWLTVNSVCFFYYFGQLSVAVCIWNLAGFVFDILHDYLTAQKELTQHKELLLAVSTHETENDFNIVEIKEKLNEKITLLKIKKWRVTLVAIGILTGMFLFYVPILFPLDSYPAIWKIFSWIAFFAPHHTYALIEQIKDVGTGILLVFGTMIGNLGGRIIKWENKLVRLCRSLWMGNGWEKMTSPFIFIGQILEDVALFVARIIKTIWDNPSFFLSAILTIILIHFGGVAAIPFVGNYIMGFGLPTVFTVTCLSIKNIITGLKNNALKWLGISFDPKLDNLLEESNNHEEKDSENLESTISIIESLKRNNNKLETLRKSAQSVRLSTPELLKHIRNWGQENKEALSYDTPDNLIRAARQVKHIRFFQRSSQDGFTEEASLNRRIVSQV